MNIFSNFYWKNEDISEDWVTIGEKKPKSKSNSKKQNNNNNEKKETMVDEKKHMNTTAKTATTAPGDFQPSTNVVLCDVKSAPIETITKNDEKETESDYCYYYYSLQNICLWIKQQYYSYYYSSQK